MNVIITCGPSYEPIDDVRRITNFSTGRLGVTLANAFVEGGHDVILLKGEQSTYCGDCKAQRIVPFTTNDDLAQKLQSLRVENVDAIFHAAALCDFKVASVQNSSGQRITSKKFPTRGDSLTLELVPAEKILPRLRDWFPNARIIGWKYEAEGSQKKAIEKGWQQTIDAKTDGCVVNGPAYGEGFGFCHARQSTVLTAGYEGPLTIDALGALLLKRFLKRA